MSGLSCEFNDCYGRDGYYKMPDDFSVMPRFPRRRRCSSCKALINPGSTVLKMERCDIEDNELPPKYMCERCGEIMLNLGAAGFALYDNDNMEKLLREYWNMTGFDPEKYKTGQQKECAHE